MNTEKMSNSKSMVSALTEWIFVIVFFALGILNLLFVHLIPGIVYLFLALVYLPATNDLLKENAGFIIPLAIKIIFGLIVLWGTLAVGDLAELAGL